MFLTILEVYLVLSLLWLAIDLLTAATTCGSAGPCSAPVSTSR
jgi:hypothetical protein